MSLNRGRREVTTDEARLWREAMKGVRPFPASVAAPPAVAVPAAAAEPVSLSPPPPAAPPPARSRVPPPSLPSPPAGPMAREGGIDKRTLQRLKSGEMSIDGTIDLHGMTQTEAHPALLRFLERAAAAGQRCLLVITGKGGPQGEGILRYQVPRWLNEPAPRAKILAVVAARPQHGGDGAYYVLLRRRR